MLISVGIQYAYKICTLPILHSWPSGSFLLLGFGIHSNSYLSPWPGTARPEALWHLPAEHGYIT